MMLQVLSKNKQQLGMNSSGLTNQAGHLFLTFIDILGNSLHHETVKHVQFAFDLAVINNMYLAYCTGRFLGLILSA